MVVVGFWLTNSTSNPITTTADEDVVAIEDHPSDTVIDFYSLWLEAAQANDTDPYARELPTRDVLSTSLQEKILAGAEDFATGTHDPVLCTTVLPDNLRTTVISQQPIAAQVLIISREETPRSLAVVNLVGVDGHWQIDDISCDASESGPEIGEFSFDRSGFLLKHSVQPPLDPTKWYVIYEDDGVLGYSAVLNFNEESTCTDSDTTTLSCDDNGLAEAMQVHVQGNMSEAGVEVVRLQVQ